eukprot:921564-Prorocentrum_minimum.AAC.3
MLLEWRCQAGFEASVERQADSVINTVIANWWSIPTRSRNGGMARWEHHLHLAVQHLAGLPVLAVLVSNHPLGYRRHQQTLVHRLWRGRYLGHESVQIQAALLHLRCPDDFTTTVRCV